MGKEKIIIPLDVDSAEKAVELVRALKDDVGAFKVGLELVNYAGLGIFDKIRAAGATKIFYDCKFHDIPNTVAGASRAAAGMNVWLFNVHCSGGFAMMKAAKDAALEAAEKAGVNPPLVIGVTILTSIDQPTLNNELRTPGAVADQVVNLAKLAKEAGLDGVVASPHEIESIRAACGPDFLIITPGVRPAGGDLGDQKRVMTPAQAVSRGADYLVIGRPITKAENPKAAAQAIAAEI
ncbi:MAG: orotidine-5'-phosphate decarboxylase [Armatimonadetes bacterium]|nr:orotidine-5'-phosphate decarboxylase [Armatimonadota bacterium]